jgi:methyltransferase (TIGR00027 family)
MAAVRARETARSDRLFNDPLAQALAGREGFDLMTRMEADLPENPALPIRTRYFDDALVRVLSDAKIGQVVVLAAGMDARAFRLDLPLVFEIDQPALLELKQARLVAASATPRSERIAVATDLTDAWTVDLLHAGFADQSPTAFLAEGLLGYLEENAVHRLLDDLDTLARPGSFLLADVGGRSALESRFTAFWYQRCAENGISNARFGTDDPEGLFAAHGWDAQVKQYGEEAANFGRWPYPVTPRGDLSLPHNYLIVAKR